MRIRKLPLNERFKGVDKFQQLIESSKNNLILLVDNNYNIWELIKRDDLNAQALLSKSESLLHMISSVVRNDHKVNNQYDDNRTSSKNLEEIRGGYNYYQKENSDNSSINTSIINFSKNEFNLSILLK